MNYNEHRRCPKCDGLATTEYSRRLPANEMKRVCIRCGFVWYAKPLDGEERQNERRSD